MDIHSNFCMFLSTQASENRLRWPHLPGRGAPPAAPGAAAPGGPGAPRCGAAAAPGRCRGGADAAPGRRGGGAPGAAGATGGAGGAAAGAGGRGAEMGILVVLRIC